MQSKDLLPLYELVKTPALSYLGFGVSHFFNRTKTKVSDWDSYNLIYDASLKNRGKLILGQIPLADFQQDLVPMLKENGLVVSCNDCFELTGTGTVFDVIAPYKWSAYAIQHHHLPFTDFSDNASLALIMQALEKMREVHKKNGNIYLHCKAGRSRSGLVAALFICLQENSSQLKTAKTEADIEKMLFRTVQKIALNRPQISVGSKKMKLGVQVLKAYIARWKDKSSQSDLLNLSSGNSLSKPEQIATFAQTDFYKFLWCHAFQNPGDFFTIKKLAAAIHTYATTAVDTADFFSASLATLSEKEQRLIHELDELHQSSTSFLQLSRYPEFTHPLIFQLHDVILRSDLTFKEKGKLFGKTADLIIAPDLKPYQALIKKAKEANLQGIVEISILVIAISTIILSLLINPIISPLVIVAGFVSLGIYHLYKQQYPLGIEPYNAALYCVDSLHTPLGDFMAENNAYECRQKL